MPRTSRHHQPHRNTKWKRAAVRERAATVKVEEKRPKKLFAIGNQVASANDIYTIDYDLGQGGFGEVYKVTSKKYPGTGFALKAEYFKTQDKWRKRLKMELLVYKAVRDADEKEIDKSHFVELIDRGHTDDTRYIVMELTGPSVKDLIHLAHCEKTRFSPHTKMYIARQSLQAIEALHKLGFLHRDIKLGNFAVGVPPNDHRIYLMDFGIARPFLDPQTGKAQRLPRVHVRFVGTLKYASRDGLDGQDQGRKDDFESWLYMMLDLYDPENLPWGDRIDWKNKNEGVRLRGNLLEKYEQSWKDGSLHMPKAFLQLFALLNKMHESNESYQLAVDFEGINKVIDSLIEEEKIDTKLPLDWIGKLLTTPRPKDEKKKETKMVPGSGSTGETPSSGGDGGRDVATIPSTAIRKLDFNDTKDTQIDDDPKMKEHGKKEGAKKDANTDKKKGRRTIDDDYDEAADDDARFDSERAGDPTTEKTEDKTSDKSFEDFRRWKNFDRRRKAGKKSSVSHTGSRTKSKTGKTFSKTKRSRTTSKEETNRKKTDKEKRKTEKETKEEVAAVEKKGEARKSKREKTIVDVEVEEKAKKTNEDVAKKTPSTSTPTTDDAKKTADPGPDTKDKPIEEKK